MKSKAVCTVAVLAMGLGIVNAGMAQPHDRREGGPPGMERGDNRGDRGENRGHDNRGHDNRRHDNGRHDNGRHEGERRDDRERGAGPYHNIHRGDRLPPEWRHRQYQVARWREHQLPPPPRGYVWVQLGADYALVAGGTGVVAQIVIR